ncbi:MAG TPA: glutaredoxin family protein [Luteimonas sp.]
MNATSRLQPAVQPALQLIQRDDCPLCDQALAVLAAARAPELESVWIDDVDELEAAYGMRVPVLRDTVTGAELDWPFDADRVRAWLSRAQ